MKQWVNGNSYFGGGYHGVRERLFGLGLPDNLVTAMGEFLVERLYSTSPFDVDDHICANAMGVIPYLERFCYENPSKAWLVYGYLRQAFDNATSLFSQYDVEDIAPKQREIFTNVVSQLLAACINTWAQSLAPAIQRLYDDVVRVHLPPTFIPFDTLIQRMNDAPRVFPDTLFYYRMHDEEL